MYLKHVLFYLSGFALLTFCFAYCTSIVSANGLANTDWPTWGGNSQHNKISPSTNTAPLTLQFRTTLSGQDTFPSNHPAIIGNNVIYIGKIVDNSQSGVIAFDFTGKVVWETTLPTGTNAMNPLALDEDGTIFVAPSNAGLTALNNDGSLKFSNTCYGSPRGTPLTGPVIDMTGNVIVMNGTQDSMSICSPGDGTRLYNLAPSNIGIATVDSKNIIYVDLNGAALRAYRSDITLIPWTAAVVPLGANYINSLSPDEKTIYVNSGTGLNAVRVSDGQVMWSKTNMGTNQGSIGIGKDRIFTAQSSDPFQVIALDPEAGKVLWTYPLFAGLELSRILVDSNQSIYFFDVGDESLSSVDKDGHFRWQYYPEHIQKNTLFTSIPVINSEGKAYFPFENNFYGLRPWTVEVEMKPNQTDTQKAEFTVTSSMLKRDPSAGSDNQVQIILENKKIIRLTFDKTDGGMSVWKGTYRLAEKEDFSETSFSGVVEASAYMLKTNTETHFQSLGSGFFNSGLSQKFAITNNTSNTSLIKSNTWQINLLNFFKNTKITLESFLKRTVYWIVE